MAKNTSQSTDPTLAAQTRALIARATQALIAEALYEVDEYERRQKGQAPPLFGQLGPKMHETYFERARAFLRAGYTVQKLDRNTALRIEELP